MFLVTGRTPSPGDRTDEDEEHGLKPMNCPGHCLLFASKRRSFRDLPIRFADFSSLHRSEVSGALSGLTRARRFHQDDGHIFCRPSQVGEEISRTLDFVKLTYGTFNLGPYRLALSTRPKENYIGTVEEWDNAELSLRQALDASGQVWSVNEGDGAFYGPKIDIILRDSDGKEHQTATVQLDFQLPKRFNLRYHSPAPELEQKGVTATDPEILAKEGPVQPVMIHRAVLGSIERFMALLIEHYNGYWPFWLNPRQAIILTVTNDKLVVDYALDALRQIQGVLPDATMGRAGELNRVNFVVDVDDSARTLRKKILEAKKKRYGMIVVAGRENVERGDSVTVDFSGISDPRGIILRELRSRMSSEVTLLQPEGGVTSEQLRAVEISPRALREMLLVLEREYV
jgi:threonyl-tRNA synthetase